MPHLPPPSPRAAAVLADCVAVVPAGGLASRLDGVAKPLLVDAAGRTVLDRIVDTLHDLGVGSLVVVAPEEVAAHTAFAPPRADPGSPAPASSAEAAPVLVTREDPPFSGPAAGLAAGLSAFEAARAARGSAMPTWTLVLAADMPDPGPGVLALAEAARADIELHLGLTPVPGESPRREFLFSLTRTSPLLTRVRADSWINRSVRRLYAGLSSIEVELPRGTAEDIDTWERASDLGYAATPDTPRAAPAPPAPPHPTWHEAMEIARETAHAVADGSAPSVDTVPLAEAVGRILAHDLNAEYPIPHFDSSAMDGYVVATPEDVSPGDASAGNSGPRWILETTDLLDHAESGRAPLAPGKARPILTGGSVPNGATGVVRREYSDIVEDDAGPVLRLAAGAPASELESGRHLRRAGRETAQGELLVGAGTVLSPAHIAYLAVAGIDELPVRARPRVGFVFTGDEVLERGVPGPGQVRDTFGPVLPGVLTSWGAEVLAAHRVPDSVEVFEDALDSLVAAGADLVLTTGGTGKSGADHVRRVLERRVRENAGGSVPIPGIRMRPGHPTMLARLGNTLVVGLPGNPLAAMTALRVVARPAFEGLAGIEHAGPGVLGTRTGVLDRDTGPGRSDTLTPAFQLPDGRWRTCDAAGAGMLRGLAHASALVVLPAEGLDADRRVEIVSLPWGEAQWTTPPGGHA